MENKKEIIDSSVDYATERLAEGMLEGYHGNGYGCDYIKSEVRDWFLENLDGVLPEERVWELWVGVKKSAEDRFLEMVAEEEAEIEEEEEEEAEEVEE